MAQPDQTYASPDQWLSIDPTYEAALRDLEVQSADWDKADDRLRLLIGFVALASITVSVAVPPTGGMPANLLLVFRAVQLFAGLALLLLLAAGAIALVGYRPRPFHRPPNTHGLRTESLTQLEAQTKLDIIDQILRVYNFNDAVIREKLTAYQRALYIFVASMVLLSLVPHHA